MDLQIPLLIIDRRSVSIMSTLFTNRRVTHLRFVDAFDKIRNIGEYFASTGILSGDLVTVQGGIC